MSDQKANVPSYIERLKKPVGVPPFIQREVANILQWHVDEIERLTAEKSEAIQAFAAEVRKNEKLRAVYDAAHKAAMYCVRDGDGEAHIAVRFMQPLDDALNALAAVEDKT